VGNSPLDVPRRDAGFIWDGKHAPVDLGSLGGNFVSPRAVNRKGIVVGDATTASAVSHAFVWRNGALIDVGANPFFSQYSAAVDVNDQGDAIGVFSLPGDRTGGFLWQDGAITRVARGSVEPDVVQPELIIFTGFNVKGQFSAILYLSDENGNTFQHAMFYDGTQMLDLSGGAPYSQAAGLNDDGEVTLWFFDGNTTGGSAVWKNGQLRQFPLNEPNVLTQSVAINSAGHVAVTRFNFTTGATESGVWLGNSYTAVPDANAGIQFLSDDGYATGTTSMTDGNLTTFSWRY
jgi:probable HAF family extracellular repeat protein